MSFVLAAPEMMSAAATDLATIGETLNAAHMTAAAPTVAVPPAAADEVSAGIAHLMSGYGQEYQKLAGQAAASHAQFVQNLTASASSYASAEDVIASLLQALDATGQYYTIAGATLAEVLVGEAIWLGIFALVPPLLPLFPIIQVLFLARVFTLLSEVITGSPISYPAYLGP